MMIGVDPHKGSHTAVAVDEGEQCYDTKLSSGGRGVGASGSGRVAPRGSGGGVGQAAGVKHG